MKKKKNPLVLPNWETSCKHDFPVAFETIRDPDFNVAYGCKRVCKLCGAIEFENWCETRASGGTPRIYPPENADK